MSYSISIIIRTYNESRYLDELLNTITTQKIEDNYEIIIVDSGSTDETLDIAKKYETKIITIEKKDFTFGRSLNYGCEAAIGDYLVIISGHCIPTNSDWLSSLVYPLKNGISYTYGKQIGREKTKFSEKQVFKKYYPNKSVLPQKNLFCNNANSALKKEIWSIFKFNEDLTGCEDMFLAKQIMQSGFNIGYVAEAIVYHLHDETWIKTKKRYERESQALLFILPEIHLSVSDTISLIIKSIFNDFYQAHKEKVLFKNIASIIKFRTAQYYGSYIGNKRKKILSQKYINEYFYP